MIEKKMIKNEKYTIGMIVKDGSLYGVVNDVGTDGLDGDKVSVRRINGNAKAWWRLDNLEIIENPLEKYRQACKDTKVIFTDDNGNTYSCEFDEKIMIETAERILRKVGAGFISCDVVSEWIIVVLEEGCLNDHYDYYDSDAEFFNKKNKHVLTITIEK